MVGHEDARPAGGNILAPFHAHADAGGAEAGADNEAGHGVERPHVAGDHGQRNEDDRRGNAQNENDDENEKRNNHENSIEN